MKKILVLVGASLALSASLAMAAPGVNLRWDDCGFSAGICGGECGAQTKTLVCPTGTDGLNCLNCYNMIGSYVAPDGLQITGIEAVIDLQTSGATLAPYWDMSPTGCRSTGIFAASFGGGTSACTDWPSAALGGFDYAAGFGGLNRARLRIVAAPGTPFASNSANEQYAFTVTFRRSNGANCAGCTDGLGMVLNQIRLGGALAPFDLTSANRGDQGVQANAGIPGFPGVTPTRNATWGAVKALYR